MSYLTVPARSGIFRLSYLRYPRIPRYFGISIPTVPARSGIFRYNTYDTHVYPGNSGFQYLPYRQNQVFSKATPTIPTIPRYFGISIPTVPAKSGIFESHTYDTHAYPGISGFRYLPYRQDQVFSGYNTYDTPVFLDFDTYRTGKIGYFQV